jgi:hypothetical protein
MKHDYHSRFIISIGLLVVLTVAIASDELADMDMATRPEPMNVELIAVAPPPFSEGVFPCSECHFEDDEVDREPREVDFHDTVVFRHANESRWCLDCHDTQNRDMLHLADGRLISFEESYRLCGQCHAQIRNDWRAGDHGRRTGDWSGKKEYLLCVHCHDPHTPTFQPITPMPPPIRQEEIR